MTETAQKPGAQINLPSYKLFLQGTVVTWAQKQQTQHRAYSPHWSLGNKESQEEGRIPVSPKGHDLSHLTSPLFLMVLGAGDQVFNL